MRAYSCGFLFVLLTGFVLAGCAKKEVIKTEEPVVPAVVAAPAPPPVPEPPRPAPPEPAKSEPVPEQIVPAEPLQKPATAETAQTSLENIYFDFDKSDLRDPDREILNRNAAILLKAPKSNVQIEGHCDERGSAEYNLALGERRASSAMNYLISLGVPAGRLSIISYGKEKPIDPGHDENAWAKNRRAQFVKSGE